MVSYLNSTPSKSPKQVTKKDKQTEKYPLVLTVELKNRIKKEAYKMFGKRKGAESMYVEQQMRSSLHMQVDGVAET